MPYKVAPEEKDELLCTFAALILNDDKMAITAENMTKLIHAAGATVESFWPKLFSRLLEGQDVDGLLAGATGAPGSGGAAPAAGAAAPAAAGGAAPAAKEEHKKEEAPKEEEEAVSRLSHTLCRCVLLSVSPLSLPPCLDALLLENEAHSSMLKCCDVLYRTWVSLCSTKDLETTKRPGLFKHVFGSFSKLDILYSNTVSVMRFSFRVHFGEHTLSVHLVILLHSALSVFLHATVSFLCVHLAVAVAVIVLNRDRHLGVCDIVPLVA